MTQQDVCTNIIFVAQLFPSPNNPCPRMADHPLNWVWILEDWSENGCGKWHFLVWNRVRIWRTGWHTPTPTKNSQESAGISRPSHLSLFHPNGTLFCWLHWNQTCLSLTLSFFRSLRQILKAWSWTKQELSKKRKEKLLLQRLNSTNR